MNGGILGGMGEGKQTKYSGTDIIATTRLSSGRRPEVRTQITLTVMKYTAISEGISSQRDQLSRCWHVGYSHLQSLDFALCAQAFIDTNTCHAITPTILTIWRVQFSSGRTKGEGYGRFLLETGGWGLVVAAELVIPLRIKGVYYVAPEDWPQLF